MLEVTPGLLADATKLATSHALRAYDAVQLAAAVELNRRWVSGGLGGIVLVSADDDLNKAAQTEGLLVENPNSYP